jgi:FixJ family two-component response regulator
LSQIRGAIFVIDDDESVRRALGRLIRSGGWQVETFATAEQFMEFAAERTPGCLILDIHLPGLSGLDLQQWLIAEGLRVPIIFITALTDNQLREQALRAGAVAFLLKPFDDQTLLDAMNQAAR